MTTMQERIKQDVVDQLAWDVRVDASDVKVEVDENRVHLTGEVPWFGARLAAEDDAWKIAGVTDVNNKLEVIPEISEAALDDEQLRRNIELAFVNSPLLATQDIAVSVEDGEVTLDGTVNSYWQKDMAEESAFNQLGSIAIHNRLTIVPTKKTGDEAIAHSITAALERNLLVDIDKIEMKVEDGIVILDGIVPDYLTMREIRSVVSRTPGVVGIQNNMILQQEPTMP